MTVLTNPTGPGQDLAWGKRSHWIQPFKSEFRTLAAERFLDSIGICYASAADKAPQVASILKQCGVKHARLEIGWGNIDFDNRNVNKAWSAGEWALEPRLQALKANGIRPLILLNSNHNEPCPWKQSTIRFTAPVASADHTAPVDAASADRVRQNPGKCGLGGTYYGWAKAASVLCMSVTGSAGQPGTVTFSRDIAANFAANTDYRLDILGYEPFWFPFKTDGTPHPIYEATLAGWIDYVRVTLNAVKAIFGAGGYDVETWNEMGFGSDFLTTANYYDRSVTDLPARQGTGENFKELHKRTVQWLRDPANGHQHASLKITAGYTSQRPWESAPSMPPGSDSRSKHPYHDARNYPGSWPTNGDMPVDALGNADTDAPSGSQQWPPRFTPTYRARCPELWINGLVMEHLMRDFRDTDEVWGTEYNMTTIGSSQDGGPVDTRAMQAKATLRAFSSWVGKGMNRLYPYADLGEGGGAPYSILPPEFYNAASPTVAQAGPTLQSLKRLVDALAGAQPIASPRQLTFTSVEDFEGRFQFQGDGSAAHPNLWNRDCVCPIPLQLTSSKFALLNYVWTRNVEPDMAPQKFRITIGGINGQAATLSATDPFTGQPVTVSKVSGTTSSLTYDMDLTDTPRVLIVDESGGVPPTPPADTTAPETTITTKPSDSEATSGRFEFIASEASTFRVQLDSSPAQAATSPFDYSSLAVGAHTFKVWAKDASGNEDQTPATHTWTITAPPPPPTGSGLTSEQVRTVMREELNAMVARIKGSL